MKYRWPATVIATAAVVMMLVSGCSHVVDGTTKPAPNLKPRPLTGQTIKQVLLDDTTLAKMLNQPIVARKPLEFGGPDKLYQPDEPAASTDCLGVTTMLRKDVYGSADIKDVAYESWWTNGQPAQVLSVMEGVVTLPTAEQAQALFTKFTDQWRQCNGVSTTEQNGPISTTNVISDIRVNNNILAATNTATSVLPEMPPLQPTPQARAIGVAMNCIVEVQVVFFGDRRPSDPGSGKVDSSAIDVTNAILAKIGAAS